MFKDLPAAARRLVRHHSKLPLPLLKIRAHPQPLKDNMMIRHLCTHSVRPGACSDISVPAMGEVGGLQTHTQLALQVNGSCLPSAIVAAL